MIFNIVKNDKLNTISINEIMNAFEAEDNSKVIVFESSFINEQLLIKDIGHIVNVNNINRYITIDRFRNAHFARMKVSAYGTRIKNGDTKNYISIYYAGRNMRPKHDGNINDIQMSNAELLEYEKLFMRNLNLIYLNGNGCPKEVLAKYGHNIEEYVEAAFIHDELLRVFIKQNTGIINNVVRDYLGNLIFLNKNNKPIISFSLDFNVIDYDKNLIYELYYHYIGFLKVQYKNSEITTKFIKFIKSTGIYV